VDKLFISFDGFDGVIIEVEMNQTYIWHTNEKEFVFMRKCEIMEYLEFLKNLIGNK